MVTPDSIQRIVFVGAGNIATHLAVALHGAGYDIAQIYSRTEASAKTLADRIGCAYTTLPQKITDTGDLYVFAVSDDALAPLLDRVSARRDALWVHTAGSLPMSVFAGKCARCGVLYPLQTFSKNRAVDFAEIPVFIEAGNAADADLLRRVAGRISRRVAEISSEQRKYLHLAAVFACNFTNHLYAVAAKLLQEHGLPFDTLLPLIRETAAKVESLAPADAQTGPAVRYDRRVMQRHLDLLDDPAAQEIYRLLSQEIHRFATEKQS